LRLLLFCRYLEPQGRIQKKIPSSSSLSSALFQGNPDYALKNEEKEIAFVEDKALEKAWDPLKLISYFYTMDVFYVIATDNRR